MGYSVKKKKKKKKKKTKKIKKDNCPEEIYARQMELKPNQLMITHFRLATSGYGKANTQPILAGNYLVIHNGIFSYTKLLKNQSDTKKFTVRINNQAKKEKIATEKKEREMLLKELKKAGGYYSIFIYSFITSKIYYFKNDMASFYWNSSKKNLGATRASRFPALIAQKEEAIF